MKSIKIICSIFLNKFKVTIFTLLLPLFFLNQADSQVAEEWSARYNGPGNLADGASKVVVDNTGNIYVTGYSFGSGTSEDYSTRKYGSNGNQLWTSRYNGPGNSVDKAQSIAVDAAGNVYVTGNSRSGTAANTEDFATIKYNSSGIQQWAARYNGTGNSNDGAYAVGIDGAGNVYVTGSSFGTGGTDRDYVTIKYNSAGVEQWVKRYNGTGNSIDESFRIAVSDSGNIYVTGYSRSGSGAGSEDCVTIKYNAAGAEQWVQRFNNGANEIGLSIAVDGQGNVYVGGFAWNGFSYIDYLTIKYNASGVQQWATVQAEQPGTEVIHSLAVDNSGNVYVTGYGTGSGSGGDDFKTIKYNSAGSLLWDKRYNGPGNGADTAYSIAVDAAGNVYVTGSSTGTGSGTDYATVKYNSSGIEQWVQRYNGPGNGTDAAYSLAVDPWGYVYVTGISAGTGTGNDYATIKYSQTGSQFTLNLTVLVEGFYNQTLNNMVSDTARVLLRSSSAPYNIIDSSKRKLSSAGNAPFLFSNAVNGTGYFLTVMHRNSIETWSSSPVFFTSGSSNYNFTTVPTQAYGNNMKQADLSPPAYAVYSGDNNQDGFVNLTDVIDVYNAAANFTSGYKSSDMNGDNLTDLTDVIITNNNSNNFVSKVRP